MRPEPVFVNLLRSAGIDSQPGGTEFWAPYTFTNTGSEPGFVDVFGAQESIPPAHVAWRAGTINRVVAPARQAEPVPGLLKRSTNTGSVALIRVLHFFSA